MSLVCWGLSPVLCFWRAGCCGHVDRLALLSGALYGSGECGGEFGCFPRVDAVASELPVEAACGLRAADF